MITEYTRFIENIRVKKYYLLEIKFSLKSILKCFMSKLHKRS